MIRARFHADDSAPVNWPIKQPFWESGFAADGSYVVVVSYADDVEYIKYNWPEARNIEILEEDAQYKFTDRFPMPSWFDPQRAE